MNRTTTRRAGDKTDICLMAGCSVFEAAFLILIIFTLKTPYKFKSQDVISRICDACVSSALLFSTYLQYLTNFTFLSLKFWLSLSQVNTVEEYILKCTMYRVSARITSLLSPRFRLSNFKLYQLVNWVVQNLLFLHPSPAPAEILLCLTTFNFRIKCIWIV